MANILVLDIETAPMEAAVWGMWQQNVSSYDGKRRLSFML